VAGTTENPYLQYFIGLPASALEPPSDASLLVRFRKRLGKVIIHELNELLFLEEEKMLRVMMTILRREPPRVAKTLA